MVPQNTGAPKIGSSTDVPMDVLNNSIIPINVLRISQYLTATQPMVQGFTLIINVLM